MADLEAVQAMIEPVVTDAGFELVRVALFAQPELTLQIMVEDPATGQILVDDCAALSRTISELLDEADPIDSEYLLEVSSPGIDRPLVRRKDYDRWAGHVARIEMKAAIPAYGADRRRFQGHLLGLDGGDVRLHVEGLGEVRLPLAGVDKAKLVLTDELLATSAPTQKNTPEDQPNRRLPN